MTYTVCILTSGIGRRMYEYTNVINKALLPVNKKAIISRIIENFPKKTQFVISIGHKGAQVKDYLELAHKDRRFQFVKIENYNGKNSGPGSSLYQCKKYLQKPFFFVACDTLWTKKIYNIQNCNWMGTPIVKQESHLKDYCNLRILKNSIKEIRDKSIFSLENSKVFTGLAFIKNYRVFWENLKSKTKVDAEVQVSNGFKGLIQIENVKTVGIDWTDVGTSKKYEDVINQFSKFNFSKSDQHIYISNSAVIKFFSDKKIIYNLVKKAKSNKIIYPKIIDKKENFIKYKYIKGKTLYNHYNENYFNKLIYFLEKNFWKKKNKKNFNLICRKFYQKKTINRLKLLKKIYRHKFGKIDKVNYINNQPVKKINELMFRMPWNFIANGMPSEIHGDLQFDNIIFNKKNFYLIDWRPDFEGQVLIGDICYDLAKLLGGIEINYDLIKKNLFNFRKLNNKVTIKIRKRKNSEKLKKILINYIERKKISEIKIRLITGLIFINMSPLHKYPFNEFLFYYGKMYLNKYLNIYEKKNRI